MGFFFAVSHVILSPVRLQLLLCASCLSVGVNTFTKLWLQHPRPFFIIDSYMVDKCEFEYGNPSGHAQNATTFYLAFITLAMQEYKIKDHKIKIYSLLTLYLVAVGATRVFGGVHTLDQVLAGCCLGAIMYILIVHIFSQTIEKWFEQMQTGKIGFLNILLVFYLLMNLVVL